MTGKRNELITFRRYGFRDASLKDSGGSLGDNDILAMRNLVSALEEAAEGGPVLDLRLGRDLQNEGIVVNDPVTRGLMAELSAETVENIVGEMVVPFTRSLDASLPGENIVFSMYSAEKNLWVSVQRGPNGQEFVAWAATEPLSRRAAALRALAGISAGSAGMDVVSLPGVESDIQDPEADSGTSQPAWRVNF